MDGADDLSAGELIDTSVCADPRGSITKPPSGRKVSVMLIEEKLIV